MNQLMLDTLERHYESLLETAQALLDKAAKLRVILDQRKAEVAK